MRTSPARLALDDLRRARHAVTAGFTVRDRLRESVDGGERRSELVRDVREERLLAGPCALDLPGHLVERAAELFDLGRSAHRHPRRLIRAERTHPPDEPAKR